MCEVNKLDGNDLTEGREAGLEAALKALRNPKNSTSPLAKPENQGRAMAKIPGMEGVNLIHRDIPVHEVLAEVAKHDGDINPLGDLLVGSKEMLARLHRRPEIYAVGNWLTGASKRSSLYDRARLTPLEHTLRKSILSGDAAHLMAVMKQEDMANARLTPEERATVLTPKQDKAYVQFREEMDIALARENEARVAKGQKPVTAREAYVSSRWGGDWKIEVMDKQGKRVFYIAESSKGKAEHALAWLAKQHPDIVDVKASKTVYGKDASHSKEFGGMAGYKEAMAILGDSDAGQLLRESNEARIEAEGSRMLGQEKHFKNKMGERGALGDRPWMNDKKNIHDFFSSQMQYLRNANKWSEMQGAIKNISELVSDPSMVKDRPELTKLVTRMARQELGFGTNENWRGIENTVSKKLSQALDVFPVLRNLPTDVSSINSGMGLAKEYFYISKLGLFNLPFAAINIVQPVFTIPHHQRLSGEGFNHNPAMTAIHSITMMAATVLPSLIHSASGVKLNGADHIPQIFRDGYSYMDANGMLGHNQYSDAGHVSRGPVTTKILDILKYTITAPEQIARTTAFMGYVSHLDQSGKFKGDDIGLFKKAEEMVDLSMVNYNKTERAGVFQEMGTTGNGLATLNAFKINQFNQLYDFGKLAFKEGNYVPLVTMLLTQTMMGGAIGMYGIQQADWIWENIKDGLVAKDLLQDPDIINFSIKGWALQNMDSLISMGAFSKVAGDLNWSSKYDAGTIVDPSMAGLLPFVADAGKQLKAWTIDLIAEPNQVGLEKAIYASAPTSLRGAAEMNLPTKSYDGNAYSEDSLIYRRTDRDKQARGIPFVGLPTVDEFKGKDAAYRDRMNDENMAKARTVQLGKIKSAALHGTTEGLDRVVKTYIKQGGELDDIIKLGIEQPLKNRATTSYEKEVIKALEGNELSGAARERLARHTKTQKSLQETR